MLLKFAVAVIMIAAAIFGERVCWILLACDDIQLSDVIRFHVFLQHSLLPNCHCRFVSEHRSSSLGNVIDFPSTCTLLESKRSTQLLRLIMQQAFANMCLSKCLPLLLITLVVPLLPSKSSAQSESTCTCNIASDVCRAYVSTHLLFSPGIDPTS